MYGLFWEPFGISFFRTVFESFLVTLHELYLATVNLISGSVMHCVKTWRNLCELELHK